MALALPHQLWTGREFLDSLTRTAFRWGLWGVAGSAVVLGRIVLPAWRSLRHRLVVSAVVPEGDGCVSVYMTGEHLDELGARDGHWFSWRFLSGTGWTRAHPYSLSVAPDGRRLRVTVKDRGDGSATVAGLRVGKGPRRGPLRPADVAGADSAQGGADRIRRRREDPVRAPAEDLDGTPGDVVVLPPLL